MRVLFLLITAFCLGACAVKPVVKPEAALDSGDTVTALRPYLANGYWLVTRGVHGTDNIVSTLTNMPLSHAGIYDAGRDMVIEAEGQGVHESPLDDFIAKSSRILLIRPLWWSEKNAEAAIARARTWIGKGYNFTGLAGINTPDRYYCTQLAIEAYRPFITVAPDNPIPRVIAPGRMYHWGRILFDTGPSSGRALTLR